MSEKLLRLVRLAAVGAAAGVVIGALAGWVVAQFLHVPQVDALATFRPATASHVFDASGAEIASWAVEQRVELAPEQIPDHLKQAIVAIEDADFYEHGGVDPRAITRAALVMARNWIKGRDRIVTQGGSTLTQQLALNLFLKREKTLTRKIKEALLAIDIEKRFSKDQILTMYANQVFFGHGAYGVEAAAQLYFDKTAMELSLAEAALIAGMIPSANNLYNPIKRPENALARRNKVLDRMLEQGYIDAEAHAAAVAEPLAVTLHRERVRSGAYFLEAARKEIERRYGTDALYTSGLEVHLTMDPFLQRLAEDVVRNGLMNLEMLYLGWRKPANVLADGSVETIDDYSHPSWRSFDFEPRGLVPAVVTEVGRSNAELRIGERQASLDMEAVAWTGAASMRRLLDVGDLVLVRLPEELPDDPEATIPVELRQEPEIEGALIAMDNQTGAIRAMVGGFDFERSEFNRALQSTLQCGSAFKPFVYLTAFQQGYTPADTLFDGPFLLPDGEGELTYCPKNYYNVYYGITTLRRALELSYNATAVKLQQLVGSEQVVETARRFGISTELHPYPSLALGSLGVRLVDLVRAYSAIANLGELPEPYYIAAVNDRDGRPLERFYPRIEPIMPAPATYLALHVLRGVIERGTGQSARWLDANLAGKTGTTDDYSDAWFVGFSPRMTVGVWVGRDRKEPIGKKMTGAKAAQPIWNEFMKGYLDTLDEATRAEDFSVPAGVVFTPVDADTGERAVPPCSHQTTVILEAFLDGTEPTEPCREREVRLKDLPWPFQLAFYEPKPGEPMPDDMALAVADERLKPTPTPEEEAAMAAAEAAGGVTEGAR